MECTGNWSPSTYILIGHIMETPGTRLTREIIEKLWHLMQQVSWIKEIRQDIDELEITLDDSQNKH